MYAFPAASTAMPSAPSLTLPQGTSNTRGRDRSRAIVLNRTGQSRIRSAAPLSRHSVRQPGPARMIGAILIDHWLWKRTSLSSIVATRSPLPVIFICVVPSSSRRMFDGLAPARPRSRIRAVVDCRSKRRSMPDRCRRNEPSRSWPLVCRRRHRADQVVAVPRQSIDGVMRAGRSRRRSSCGSLRRASSHTRSRRVSPVRCWRAVHLRLSQFENRFRRRKENCVSRSARDEVDRWVALPWFFSKLRGSLPYDA